MKKERNKISAIVDLINGDTIRFPIVPEYRAKIKRLEEADAISNGEASIQIMEGCTYEYSLPEDYKLFADSGVIKESNLNPSSGRIIPNNFVGTMCIDVLDKNKRKIGDLELEVQSVKTEYRSEYRFMLEEITDICTELLMQYTSPVNQFFTLDHSEDSKTLYQRFAFLKSVLNSDEFKSAIHRIILAPATTWKSTEEIKDIRAVRKVDRSVMKQLTSSSNRVPLVEQQRLKRLMKSVPEKITTSRKVDTPDTPENRFIKHALETFRNLCGDFKDASKSNTRLHKEAKILEEELDETLNHSLFQAINRPHVLPLNSPILQRKEGYREVLKTWLMLNLAARLTWNGGDDVYDGGKRDVATLYEYWLFFKLMNIIEDVFKIDALKPEELIEETGDRLGLKLKQGRHLALKGLHASSTRKLNVEFNYNRTFSGNSEYPDEGSWTRPMRPDYTLSIWPYGIKRKQAEVEELIVHIHFDAKYKVDTISSLFGEENENLSLEKEEQNRGTYRRVDLLKMHAYRDSIRRSAGAYILYPGNDLPYRKLGFHEIIPGLGAFTIRPDNKNNGSQDLKDFLKDVLENFLNRVSQSEQYSYQRYNTFKSKGGDTVNSLLPEPFGKNRSLLPDSTSVLVGYYHDEKHLKWIITEGLYNTRTGSRRGSLKLGEAESGAKFILLHSKKELITNKILMVSEVGPRLFSKQDLINLKYPKVPSSDFYLVYRVAEVNFEELKNRQWDIRQLPNYKTGQSSALPFTTTLAELMNVEVLNTD